VDEPSSVLGDEAPGEVLGFVVASVEFEVLTAMVDYAEGAAELLVLGVAEGRAGFGNAMAPFVGAERAAEPEVGHIKQIAQEVELHSEVPLVSEIVRTADTVHTVDTAACRDCVLGNVAGNTAGNGVAAGTAQLL
jgi:hypothetical protein